ETAAARAFHVCVADVSCRPRLRPPLRYEPRSGDASGAPEGGGRRVARRGPPPGAGEGRPDGTASRPRYDVNGGCLQIIPWYDAGGAGGSSYGCHAPGQTNQLTDTSI